MPKASKVRSRVRGGGIVDSGLVDVWDVRLEVELEMR